MCLTNCKEVLLWQWAMGMWFHSWTGISIPNYISLLFRLCEGSTPMFLSIDRNCKPRENPNWCALFQQTMQVGLGEKLQLYFCTGKGQYALTQMLLGPEMWNSRLHKVWHRSFQNRILFSLMKCAGGAGVGVAKVAGDEVKLCDCSSGPAWLMPIIAFSLWKGNS